MDNHVFVDGYFTNNERTAVETVWYSEQEDTYRVFNVVAEEGDAEWEKLLEMVTIDDLHERTYKKISDDNEEFRDTMIKVATNDDNSWVSYRDDLNKDALKAFINVVFDQNLKQSDPNQKEKLFLYKMELFERDDIKACTDRELKKELRKATNMIDATMIACQMLRS